MGYIVDEILANGFELPQSSQIGKKNQGMGMLYISNGCRNALQVEFSCQEFKRDYL